MVEFLVQLVVAVLRALIPALRQAATPTAENAARQNKLRERLTAKVRKHWSTG